MKRPARRVLSGAAPRPGNDKRLTKQHRWEHERCNCSALGPFSSGFLMFPSTFVRTTGDVYLEGRGGVLRERVACTARSDLVCPEGPLRVPGGAHLNTSAPSPSLTTVLQYRSYYRRLSPVTLAARGQMSTTRVTVER